MSYDGGGRARIAGGLVDARPLEDDGSDTRARLGGGVIASSKAGGAASGPPLVTSYRLCMELHRPNLQVTHKSHQL